MDEEAARLAHSALQDLIRINGWQVVDEKDWPEAQRHWARTIEAKFIVALVRRPGLCLVGVRFFPVSIGGYNILVRLWHPDGRVEDLDQEGNVLSEFLFLPPRD